MYKTSVYILVNGDTKTAKIIKKWYHSPSHRLTVNVLLNNITFLWFLLFSMCHSLHFAVNKCINWCFVHLYLLFYYNNKLFLCWWSIKKHQLHTAMKTLNLKYFGVTILIFRGHVTSSVTWPLDSSHVVSYWWSIGTMRLYCTVTEI